MRQIYLPPDNEGRDHLLGLGDLPLLTRIDRIVTPICAVAIGLLAAASVIIVIWF
ncbi:MAG: hypothetical protein KGR26_13305 [Cyanobacteria bacterium REEB65]|nr:hypothetical protein [Cyanobacteria bacterium REEB65]